MSDEYMLLHLPADSYEIIVVDDGSKDTGAQVVSTFAERHRHISTSVRKTRLGGTQPRTDAARDTSGLSWMLMTWCSPVCNH